jgi:hypothetical protein
VSRLLCECVIGPALLVWADVEKCCSHPYQLDDVFGDPGGTCRQRGTRKKELSVADACEQGGWAGTWLQLGCKWAGGGEGGGVGGGGKEACTQPTIIVHPCILQC